MQSFKKQKSFKRHHSGFILSDECQSPSCSSVAHTRHFRHGRSPPSPQLSCQDNIQTNVISSHTALVGTNTWTNNSLLCGHLPLNQVKCRSRKWKSSDELLPNRKTRRPGLESVFHRQGHLACSSF